jgi:aminoglycoside 6'-N-acetyltransferase
LPAVLRKPLASRLDGPFRPLCCETFLREHRHAGIDIYLDPAEAGKGLGTDAVRPLACHLIDDLGHRRLVIDPAADNVAAIRRPVGVMRRYELGLDGTFHDGLLMDLLADELVRD